MEAASSEKKAATKLSGYLRSTRQPESVHGQKIDRR
jgi:hypothetical protein